MTRSFPGYFKPSILGKKRCFPSTKHLKVTTKNTAISFYLLPRNTSHTSLPSEELELMQAGLGKKTVTLPEDGDHTEVPSSIQLFV
ncbi:hypothetical protein ILYODFUR_029008 [Ilyodon furcidens]|uniref:Uncharacterized protein n=1 Tax=Ilyodon furcidens TaxID=33524 RepID=A0ABV0UZB1_9TELE